MMVLMCRGQAVPTSSLSRSPADRCTKPYFFTIMSHCVPLPDPAIEAVTLCHSHAFLGRSIYNQAD